MINKAATDSLKRVSLELGGKSPVIVLPDADLDTVIRGAAGAIFFNAGQVCAAGSRLYVHRKLFDRVVEGVGAAAQSIRLGPGLDPDTQMGPLVSREQQERVMGYIQSGRQRGRLDRGRRRSAVASGLLRAAHGDRRRARVRCAWCRKRSSGRSSSRSGSTISTRSPRLANDTPYGLSASIWSNDLRAVHRLVPKIKAGTVWVNTHGPVDANMPFGGFKQSGLGREHGRVGIEMYTEVKSVCMFV